MNMAAITLTSGGLNQAKKLQQFYPELEIYTTHKHLESGCRSIDNSLSELIKGLFESHQVLVFIMATGIVVRTIAPFLKHKAQDPAVLVMDEKGQFVISLLSGHLGKANEWSEKMASDLKATPVITTASDVNGVMAVDLLAETLQCGISDFKQAKEITALLIEKKPVGIFSTISLSDEIKMAYANMDGETTIDGLIYISDQAPEHILIPYVWLIPKTLTVGIGCKRGKTQEELLQFLKEVFDRIGKPLQSVKQLVTVEIKQDEVGLIALVKILKIPLVCLALDEIRTVEHLFEGSEFVKKTLGIKAVSEPCGYIGSNYGHCLLPLQKKEGMTISIWQNEEREVG